MTREEAISRIENHMRIHSKQEPFRACRIQEALKTAIEALKAQEPVNVSAAPVVHAHWIETKIPANTTGYGGVGQDKNNGWLCSNCRCAFDAKLLWCKNYCPNCGAKMDGDEEPGT